MDEQVITRLLSERGMKKEMKDVNINIQNGNVTITAKGAAGYKLAAKLLEEELSSTVTPPSHNQQCTVQDIRSLLIAMAHSQSGYSNDFKSKFLAIANVCAEADSGNKIATIKAVRECGGSQAVGSGTMAAISLTEAKNLVEAMRSFERKL